MRRAPDSGTYLAVAALVALWGTAFLLMKIATVEAAPMVAAGWRIWIGAAVVLAASLALGRGLPRDRRVWLWSGVIGLFSVALPFGLLALAAPRLPSGVIGVYMAAIPLVVLPLAHVLSDRLDLGERLTREKALGVALGAVGVAALFGLDRIGALGSADSLGQLACLGAALSYAIGSISIRAMPQTEPIAAAALQLLIGAALIAPAALLSAPEPAALVGFSFDVWAALIGLGLGATGLGMILRVYVISTAGPVFMSTSGYLVPLTALLVGWALGGERFAAADLAGAALILAGVAVSRGALRQGRWRRPAA